MFAFENKRNRSVTSGFIENRARVRFFLRFSLKIGAKDTIFPIKEVTSGIGGKISKKGRNCVYEND